MLFKWVGILASPILAIVEAVFRRNDRMLDRGIFVYYDGKRTRHGDPLTLDAGLKKHGGEKLGDLISVVTMADTGLAKGNLAAEMEQQREEAITELVKIARAVFGLKPVEEGGVTGAECIQVLARYLGFLNTLKERYGPLPISPARPAQSPEELPAGP